MKKLLLCLFLILAAAGAAQWFYFSDRKPGGGASGPPRAPRTARAETGDLEITVSASGRVVPERQVDIKSKASGEVVGVYADVSDEVRQGMLLFKLDPSNEERSVARLRATLSMSRAKLEQVRLAILVAEARLAADSARALAEIASAEAERDEFAARQRRAQQLFEQKVITREELDTSLTRKVQTESALANARVRLDELKAQALELDRTRQEADIAAAQVENDSVALADAEQRLRETEVFSPIDGVVSERGVQEGFIVASGVSNVGGGTTAIKLIDLSRIYAIAAVDESDIRGVVPGVEATITADAYKGMEFPGKVVRVAAAGVVESNVVTFDVKVEITGRRKQLLKPEMTTNVVLRVDGRKNAVLVPAAAVVRKAARNQDAPAGNREAAAGVPPPAPEGASPAGGWNPGGGGTRAPRPADEPDYSRRQSYVTVIRPGGGEEERLVETGLSDGLRIEIVSGLSAGEEVLLLQADGESRWAGQAGAGRRPPPGPM